MSRNRFQMISKVYLEGFVAGLSPRFWSGFLSHNQEHGAGGCDLEIVCHDVAVYAHSSVIQKYIPAWNAILDTYGEGYGHGTVTIRLVEQGPFTIESVWWLMILLYCGVIGFDIMTSGTRMRGLFYLIDKLGITAHITYEQVQWTTSSIPFAPAMSGLPAYIPLLPYDSKTGEALDLFRFEHEPQILQIRLIGGDDNRVHFGSFVSKLLTTARRNVSQGRIRRPRQPPNCFMLFSLYWRQRLTSFYPFDSTHTVSRLLGQVWLHLDPNFKILFRLAAALAKLAHQRIFPKFQYVRTRTSGGEKRRKRQYRRKVLRQNLQPGTGSVFIRN